VVGRLTSGRVKWALLGGALAVFVGVTLFVIVGSDSGSSGPGPLVLPAPERLSLGAPIPMGEAFSLGYLLVENDSDHPVTIDQASLVRAERGIEFIGAYALPIPNHRAIGFVKGYHIRPEGKTLAGLEVAPHVRVQIILGMQTTQPGRYQFEAVKLDYRDGKTSFHDTYPVSGRLCSPAEKYLNHCPQLLLDAQKQIG
jgi:hypothetical protein